MRTTNWFYTRINNQIINLSLSLIFVFSGVQISFSQTEKYLSYLPTEELLSNSSFSVTDAGLVLGTASNYEVLKKEAFVSLVYSKDKKTDLDGESWQLKVDYTLQFHGVSAPPNESGSLLLTITDAENIEEDLKIFSINSDIESITLTITDICVGEMAADICDDSQILTYIPTDVRLELAIEANRFVRMVNPSPPTLFIDYDAENKTNQKAEIQWNFVPGALGYDLEWVYVDDKTSSAYSGMQNPEHFERATRIRVKSNCHTINVAYPSGRILARVTPVGLYSGPGNDALKEVFYGPTSQIQEITIHDSGFEKDKNWQVTRTFAENGKQKDIVQYYDDGLKPRQTITNLSTDKLILSSDAIYDYHGRARMNVLPSPVLSETDPDLNLHNNLFYKPNLTLNYNDEAYSAVDFDRATGAAQLNEKAGSGRYYSSANDLDVLYRDYIPNGNGYPFSVTEYKQDNTGRITRQSGVGEFYKLGSDRETKYFYTSAKSTELRRLFGYNVGLAKHYKKNYVIDANGQISISYLDQAGRVIATALTGNSPDNVIGLSSNSELLNISLLDNNDKSSGRSLTTASIMNIVSGESFTFNYQIDQGASTIVNVDIPDEPPLVLTNHCSYLLKIVITDPCGELVDSLSQRFIASGGPITNASLITPFTVTFDQIGEYLITKELIAIDGNIDDIIAVLTAGGVIPELGPMQDSAAALIDTTSCADLCETCVPDDQAVIDALVAGSMASCDRLLTALKGQVSPGGYLFNSNEFVNSHYSELENLTTPCSSVNFGSCSDADCRREIILNNWQDCFADVWVLHHEEYCHYTRCMAENVIPADPADLLNVNVFAWNAELSLVKNWTEARNNNEWLELDPNGNGRIVGDPFFNGGPGDVTDPNSSDDFPTQIQNYQADYSLFFEDAPAGMSLEDYVEDLFNNPVNPNGPALTDENKWETFRSMYLGLQNWVRIQLVENASDCDYIDHDFAVVPKPEVPEFSNQEEYSDYITQQTADHCGDICAGSVYFWMTNLIERCPNLEASPADQELIRDELYDFCASSCFDGTNPLGQITIQELANSPQEFSVTNAWLMANCGGIVLDSLEIAMDIPGYQNCQPVANELEIGCDLCALMEGYLDVGEYIETADGDYIWRAGEWDVEGLSSLIATLTTNEPSSNLPVLQENKFQDPYALSYFLYNYLNDNSSNSTCLRVLNSIIHPSVNHPGGYPNSMLGFLYNFFGINYPIPDQVAVDMPLELCSILNAYDPCSQNLVDNFNAKYKTRIGCWELDRMLFLGSCFNNPPEHWWIYTDLSAIDPPCPDSFYVCNFDLQEPPTISEEECIDALFAESYLQTEQIWNEIVNEAVTDYILAQGNQCMEGLVESFSYQEPNAEHQFTLYYYDQAGSLVQTIPPEAVKPLGANDFNSQGEWLGDTENLIANEQPDHNSFLITRYRYNSNGQVTWQYSPDENLTTFYYDDKSRLKLSQNAKQKVTDDYSFSKYDEHDRIELVGEVLDYVISSGVHLEQEFPDQNLYTLREQTLTSYNEPEPFFPGPNVISQENLRNRVAASYTLGSDGVPLMSTFYNYDIHGNVKSMEHKMPIIGDKVIEYDYDLISGNVNEVAYQSGELDQFFHRYEYDADNRLTYAYTSRDGYLWDVDSRNFYYAHGPMARMEVGNDVVQGLDYYYNLQGWIKGVNLPGTDSHTFELGIDGLQSDNNWHANVSRDEFSYALGYNENDYHPIGGMDLAAAGTNLWSDLSANILSKTFNYDTDNDGVTDLMETHKGLFNGNIVAMVTDVKDPVVGIQAMAYQYDALHRIKQGIDYNLTGTNWSVSDQYSTNFAYDKNGNLDTLTRLSGGTIIDKLGYGYERIMAGNDMSPKKHNRLLGVADGGTNGGVLPGQDKYANYTYDKIGNLITNAQDDVDLDWNQQRKVLLVEANNPTDGEVFQTQFAYDPSGNRLSKKILYQGSGNPDVTQYYVRDAQGNVLSTYSIGAGGEHFQKEVGLFASNRLGLKTYTNYDTNPVTNTSGLPTQFQRIVGEKSFELSNHLGNVLAVVSDEKSGIDEDGNGIDAEHYVANVNSANDYYPFGMLMDGRAKVGDGYRYGFNGKERDVNGEWGSDTHYDYGFRIYNPGIGKFLSVDPLTKSYPSWTPYAFAMNRVVNGIDLDGLEFKDAYGNWTDEYNGRYVKLGEGRWLYSRQLENDRHQYWTNDGERWIDQGTGGGYVIHNKGNYFTANRSDLFALSQFSKGLDRAILQERAGTDLAKDLYTYHINEAKGKAAKVIGISASLLITGGLAIEAAPFILATNYAAGAKTLIAGSFTERAVAGGAEIFGQTLFNATNPNSEWNFASTASAIAFPRRFFLSGAIGGGLDIGGTTDSSGKSSIRFKVDPLKGLLGGISGHLSGIAGNGISKLFASNPADKLTGIGAAHFLSNTVGLIPAAGVEVIKNSIDKKK